MRYRLNNHDRLNIVLGIILLSLVIKVALKIVNSNPSGYPDHVIMSTDNLGFCSAGDGELHKIRYTYANETDSIKYMVYKILPDNKSNFYYISEEEALKICLPTKEK